MPQDSSIKLSEQKQIYTHRDDDQEKWYFPIVDVIEILTEQPHHQGASNYWKVLKNRLLEEDNQTVTNCNCLKFLAGDGKLRLTYAAGKEQPFRLVQSIPSLKAESFRLWLTEVDPEWIDEIEDPEKGIDRLMEFHCGPERRRSGKCCKA